jgi:hypothetical protein
LTVRQSLSQGTSLYVQNLVSANQTQVISQLFKLISILLPTVNKDTIMNITTKFISKAVELKTAMTEERAVYQFFWVAGGGELNPGSVKVHEGERGVVGMCTFPGLARKVKDESTELVNVVKAEAKSLSSLER